MRRCRVVAASVIVLLGVLGLAACGGDDSAKGAGAATSSGIDEGKPSVRFALVTLKIPGSDLLTPFGAGADAAAKQINAKGGFGGREVVIDRCNSQGSPAATAICARKTLAEDPIAMFGCELSWSAAGLKVYARAEVPSFTCPNTKEDFNNPWSFGLAASGLGENLGLAKHLCTKPDVKRVVFLSLDLSQLKDTAKTAMPTLTGCGKQVTLELFPLNAADMTPFVHKALRFKPDFVMMFPLAGAQGVQLFKTFHQAGFPASKLSATSSSFDYETTLKPAGSSVDGAYSAFEYKNWGQTDDPDVAAYLEAMKSSSEDARSSNPQHGYNSVMWFYAAAKQIGFDTFDSASLAEFMRTKSGVQMPLSRKLVNPGPKGYPQLKQPYVQLVQWKDGKLRTVEQGTQGGWISGF